MPKIVRESGICSENKYLEVSARVWVAAHVVWGVAVAVGPYQEGVVGATKTLDTWCLSSVVDPDLAKIFVEIYS